MPIFFLLIPLYIFSVCSTHMYSSDPLYPNDFYLQQDFIIQTDEKINESNFNPSCISNDKSGTSNIFKCYQAGTHTLSINSNQSIIFQILERKKTYRWSFSIFERSDLKNSARFIEKGKSYFLRIWVTRLSFDSHDQDELNCESNSISQTSQMVTQSFYSLGEFPIVSFTEFNEYDVGPAVFNNQYCYWEVGFTVSNLFLRSLTIKGHDNSDIFDVVSQITFNFQYKSIIKTDSSQLFSKISSPIKGHIESINTLSCYPNCAIATVTDEDSASKKHFFYTNDDFKSIYEFGHGRNFDIVYISLNGIYYTENNKVKIYDNLGEHDLDVPFASNDRILGFFSDTKCDFFRSHGDEISYENKFIGVFSSKKIFYSFDGTYFREITILNKYNISFLSVSYKWQSVMILSYDSSTQTTRNSKIILDDNKNEIVPFVVNYDLTNRVASRINLPFTVSYGKVKFGSDYGFFITGDNLLFSPDARSVSSIFLPGHFETNKNSYISSFIQKGDHFVLTVSDKNIYCGNYKNSKAVQLFDNPNNGNLILDSQDNIMLITINEEANGFTSTPVMYYVANTIDSYSKIINGEITPRYLDSGDVAVTNITLATVSNAESSILILPPKNAILSYSSYVQYTPCSTLITYINRHIDILTDTKSSSEICTTYYLSMKTLHLSTYSLQSRRGEGGEEGSTRLQVYVYSKGKVFDVYNVPLIFGCSPRRRLGIKLRKKICYPDQNGDGCVLTVFYNNFFKPIPLIFDDDKLIGEATFDYALISSTPTYYKMSVGDAGCLREPQTYEKIGDQWSRNTYESCFAKGNIDSSMKKKDYTILNLTHNEVKIKEKKVEYIEFKLINLGPSSTMCQLQYTFKVKILEQPIKGGYIALFIIVACVIVANAMFFEYWQFISFMFSEVLFIKYEKLLIEKEKKQQQQSASNIYESTGELDTYTQSDTQYIDNNDKSHSSPPDSSIEDQSVSTHGDYSSDESGLELHEIANNKKKVDNYKPPDDFTSSKKKKKKNDDDDDDKPPDDFISSKKRKKSTFHDDSIMEDTSSESILRNDDEKEKEGIDEGNMDYKSLLTMNLNEAMPSEGENTSDRNESNHLESFNEPLPSESKKHHGKRYMQSAAEFDPITSTNDLNDDQNDPKFEEEEEEISTNLWPKDPYKNEERDDHKTLSNGEDTSPEFEEEEEENENENKKEEISSSASSDSPPNIKMPPMEVNITKSSEYGKKDDDSESS